MAVVDNYLRNHKIEQVKSKGTYRTQIYPVSGGSRETTNSARYIVPRMDGTLCKRDNPASLEFTRAGQFRSSPHVPPQPSPVCNNNYILKGN